MSSIQDRLKAIRAELKISQRDFAKRIYISQSLYAELETGKRTIHERIIHLIAVQFNVNKKYLKHGDDPMFNTSPPDCKLDQLLEIFDSLDEPLQDYLLLQAKEIFKIQQTVVAKK
jgi:transcriptional regulator with XRE-family HTH domain